MLTEATLQFTLKNQIGSDEGRNSSVFVAFDQQFQTDIVIKRINKASFISGNSPSEYFHEAKVLYETSHTNVVDVKYACEDGDDSTGYIYIAMPYLRNGSLGAIIKSRFLTIREIIKYSLEFLSGLHHVHTKRLIHFDIKPGNVLISDSGQALLSDFGLSKYLTPLDMATQLIQYGTHTAPESLTSTSVNRQVDIYQAGVTIYRMCNGDEQLETQAMSYGLDLGQAILDEKFPSRDFYYPHIPIKLRKIINKMMSPDLGVRYEKVLDVLNDLSEVVDDLDWNFEVVDTTRFQLTRTTDNKLETIVVQQDAKIWNVYGMDKNITTGHEINRTKRTKSGFKNITSAFSFVNRAL